MRRPAAEALIDVLVGWGIEKIFTCPGSTEAAVLDALVDRTDIELVLTTNESVAVSMADGLARTTGRPRLAYLHANVGLSNGLANLYAAQHAYSPVVVLTGLKAAPIQARSGFTTARRMRELVSQFVKDDWQSLSTDAIAEDVNRAFSMVAQPACRSPFPRRRRDRRGRQSRLHSGGRRAGRPGLGRHRAGPARAGDHRGRANPGHTPLRLSRPVASRVRAGCGRPASRCRVRSCSSPAPK